MPRGRRKKKGGHSAIAGDHTSPVPGLVASIKQHKNFRQLASYSVKCLCKVITPPHVGWEEMMVEAFENGALEAITAVLKKHSGDEEVLSASTACLTSLATKPEYAGQLVHSGAMMSMVDSVTKNPGAEQGVAETMNLLEVVATHNPEALVEVGGMKNLTALLAASKDHPAIMGVTARTLEKMNRISGGSSSLVECGGVPIILEALKVDHGTMDTQHLASCFRLLDRLCRNPDNADVVRKANGMKLLCAALNQHKDKVAACKVGSRVLTKLASGNVAELITQMEETDDALEREFLAQLLANLALEEDNAEKIVKCGGVPSLVKTFSSPSQKTIEASSRALARIASVPENVQEVINGGAIEVLVKTINDYKDNAAIVSSCTPTLLKLAVSEEAVKKIVDEGGLTAILTTLGEHPEFEEASAEALRFVENLGAVGYDMDELVGMGAIESIVAAIQAHPDNRVVQLQGTRALIYMADSEENMVKISRAGMVEALDRNLRFAAEKKHKELAISAMFLSSSMALMDEDREAMIKGGCVDTILTAIAAFGKDEAIRDAAKDVVETVVDEASVTKVVTEVQECLAAVIASPSEEASAALIKAVGKAGAFSIVEENAEILIRTLGVQAVVSSLEQVAQASKIPSQEAILRVCSRTLMEVSDSVAQDDELRTLLGESGAVRAVITSIKGHPKLTDNVRAGVHFLESYAQIKECAKIILDEGGIQACVTAMRANQTDLQVCQDAVDTMLQLATADEGAVAVAKQGGTRQVINTVEANINTPHFSKPMEGMLRLLQRVALTTEGAEVLVKQGGVEAVIDAADALSDSARVAQASSRVLAKLLTREDVLVASGRLAEVRAVSETGTLPTPEELKPVVSRIGHMALVGTNADVIASEGGVDALASILRAVLAAEDEDLKKAMLPTAIQAVSNLAKGTTIDPSLGFVAMMNEGITSKLALTESVEALQSLAKNPANAKQMLDTGVLTTIVDTLKLNMRDAEIARNCFSALADAAQHEEVASALAGSPAVRLAQDWIDDNMDEADPDTMKSALFLLSTLAGSSEVVCGTLVEAGVVDLIKGVLTKCCIDEENPEVLAHTVTLVSGLSTSASAVEQLADRGGLKRVIRAVNSRKAYVASPVVMAATLKMLDTTCKASEAPKAVLVGQGADELIVQAMNANGNNTALLEAGATAMATLGCGAEAGASALEAVKAVSAEMGEEINEEQAAELGAAVQRLGNLMMVEGVVGRANAPEMMAVLSDSLAKLVECEAAGQESLAAGLQSIGRLASMEVLEATALTGAVEMVMDVMQLNDDSEAIRESAIHCLGNMAQGTAVISVMAQQGCMAIITEAAKSAPADEQLQSVVSQTLQKITDVAEQSAKELVAAGEEGTDALASVIEANAQDEHMLASCVEAIVASEAGEDALWSVLDSEEGTEATQAEMVRVLRRQVAATGAGGEAVKTLEGTPKRVTGLVRSMRNAMAKAGESKSGAESRTAVKAVRTMENTLSLLGDMKMDESSAAALAESGGVTQLLDMLDRQLEEPEAAIRVVNILADSSAASAEAAKAIAADKAKLDIIVEGLKVHMEDEVFVAATFKVLRSLLTAAGAEGSKLDREAMRAVQVALETHPSCSVDGTEIINQLSTVYSDEPAKIMMARLESAQTVIATAGQVQALKADDGRTYYVDRRTNATSWEPPAEIVALQATMKAMADMAAKQEADNVMEVEPSAMGHVVQALSNNAGDVSIATSAAKTLDVLSSNEVNCDIIAETGGINAIIAAIRANPQELELLRILLHLLERISRNDLIKEQVASDGGVDVVISIGILVHSTIEDIVTNCLSILANLAFNSTPNIELIMAKEGVKAVETALQAHPMSRRLLENAMCTLSNLMYGHDENKLIIGQTCGDEITDIIRKHSEDPNLFKMALRALGNLCYCDENIRFVVEEGATTEIVQGMDKNAEDEEALQLAMEVIGNFASLEEEDEEDEEQSVASIVFDQGGTAALVKYMRLFETNTALLKAGMDALSNVANDIATTELMAKQDGIVELLTTTMNSMDWDQDLQEHAVPLFTTLTYSPECVAIISAGDSIPVLLNVMATNSGNEEVLRTGQTALTNLASNEQARMTIGNIDGVASLLTLLEENMSDKEYVQEVMATLTRLSSDDELSSGIAELGTHVIMEAIKRFNRDPDFLTHAFRLLGHLAFVESNLKMIVQYDGIQVVMDAIFAHPDHKPLMVRSIQTIDNIAMANKEHAAIVIEKRGRELIEEIMDAYADDEEIVRYGKSAVLSMSALENLSRSDALAATTVGGAGAGAGAGSRPPGPPPPGGPPPPPGPPPVPEAPVDPLKNFRNMLSAGSVLNVWTKGKYKPAHVLVSPDWRSVVWQDPKGNKKLGAMDLRAIVNIAEGPGDGHKKGKMAMGRKVNPDCAFTVEGDRHSLHLEVMVKAQRKRWMQALNALVLTFKTQPSLLR